MMSDVSQDDDEKNKALRMELLRNALPAFPPQEGSAPNTLTDAEKEQLKSILPHMNLGPRTSTDHHADNKRMIDIRDFTNWSTARSQQQQQSPRKNDWYGAFRMDQEKATLAQDFRRQVRHGQWNKPTNGVCPGFLQCNLVVLPAGQVAFDFLLFCQRNKKACPLIEVCEHWSPDGVAVGADLRSDVPMYAIYENGRLKQEAEDVTEYWPEQAVAFLIGCSFSYDGALLEANIPLKSAEKGLNVPMYKTTLKCRPAGSLQGNMVVSMKPIKSMDISKQVEITSSYPHAHGGPVCVGNPKAIGIQDLAKPDWGDAIDLSDDEIPVFHACGVTPQAVLMDSKVPFAITHKAGYMFVTDLPSNVAI